MPWDAANSSARCAQRETTETTREAVARCAVAVAWPAMWPGAITPQRRPGAVDGSGTVEAGRANGGSATSRGAPVALLGPIEPSGPQRCTPGGRAEARHRLGGRRCRSWVQSIGRADTGAADGGSAGDVECGGGGVDAVSGPRHLRCARTLRWSSTSELASEQRSFDMVDSTSRPFASRRTVLAAGGVTTAAVALAACGGGSDSGGGGGGEAPAADFEERGPITLARGKDTTGK